MSSRQSLFYIAALTGHVSAAGTTVGNGGFSSPSGIDEPKKTSPAMIIDKDETSLKNDEKVIERRLGNSFSMKQSRQEEEEEEEEEKYDLSSNNVPSTTPLVVPHVGEQQQAENECCCICFDEIVTKEKVLCRHHVNKMHENCLSGWKAEKGTTCPWCKKLILQVPEIMKLFGYDGEEINAIDSIDGTVLHQIVSSDIYSMEEKEQMTELILQQDSENIKEYGTSSIIDMSAQAFPGQTALYLAVIKKETELVRMLVEHGANIDLQDGYDRTALHIAVIGEETEIVRLLVQHGANTKLKDVDGKTPLKRARKLPRGRARKEIIQILKNGP